MGHDQKDPLDRFRRRDEQQPANAPPPSLPQTAQPRFAAQMEDEELEPPRRFDRNGKEMYEAFRVRIRPCDRLEIRPMLGSWQYPRYFDLADMTVNGRAGTEIVLHFPLYNVFVKGRNLQRLVYALKESRCNFIQDYHPNEFAPVTDAQEPFIETLLITLKPKPGGNAPLS